MPPQKRPHPQTARFRPHIHHVIGTQHHILIMLHGRSRSFPITNCFKELIGRTLSCWFQTDTRLIQYIKYAFTNWLPIYRWPNGCDWLSPPDKVGGTPVHGKIIQSNIQQEAQAGAYLLYLRGDPEAVSGPASPRYPPAARIIPRYPWPTTRRYSFPCYPVAQRLLIQPPAVHSGQVAILMNCPAHFCRGGCLASCCIKIYLATPSYDKRNS